MDALVGRPTRAHRDPDLAVDAEDEGRLLDVAVPCLSRAQQLRFHDGYALHDEDRRGLRLLAQVGTSRPDAPGNRGDAR